MRPVARVLAAGPARARPAPCPHGACVSPRRLYESKGEADFMDSLLQLFRSISDMMRGASEQAVRVKVGAGPQAAGGAGAGAGDSQPDAMRGWSARSGFGFRSQRAPPAGARAARLALPALTTYADHLCSRAGPRQGRWAGPHPQGSSV